MAVAMYRKNPSQNPPSHELRTKRVGSCLPVFLSLGRVILRCAKTVQ